MNFGITQDLRHAIHILFRSPTLTAVGALSLALGIGANTAIFSLINTILLKPLPYEDPSRLVYVWETFVHSTGSGRGTVSVPNLEDWRDRNASFEALAGYSVASFSIATDREPLFVTGARVTPDASLITGRRPILGRFFAMGDNQAGKDGIVVLSNGLWRRQFGADPQIVGKTLRIDGAPAEVIGVMGPGFDYPPRGQSQLWTPLTFTESQKAARGSHWVRVLGRLRPSASIAAAQKDMDAIAANLASEYPGTQDKRGVLLKPLHEAIVGSARETLLTLWGAVGFVLVIACANVANLLLARSATRRRELAVRGALGAGRWRLARQCLAESMVLAFGGSLLGLALAIWSLDYVASMPGSSIPSGTTVHLDRNVLAFCLAAAFATALLSGLAPALRASRLDLNEALKERTSASQGGGPKDRLRSAIVVAEIALALVILVGAGLLMKSYDRLSRVESGIQSEGVLTLYLPVPGAKYSEPDQILSLYRRLLDRVREIPGVESAGTINALPLRNWGINGSFVIRGQAPAGQSERPLAERRTVDGDYFRSMGIPVLLGQGYSPGPQEGAPLEVMVNSTFAQKFFPDGAVGQFIGFGQPEEESDWSPIVGVVGDVHGAGLHRQPQAEIYFYRPQTHGWGASSSLVLRAAVDPASLVPQVRNAIREIDPEQAVFDVRVMNQVIRDSMSGRRFNTILLAAFAAIALLLSVVGVYSVVSYAVARRTYEIGVRMAMGAQRTHVLKMVIVGSLTLTVIGIAIGIPSSIGLTSLLESQLYAVKPTEPAVFLAVAVLLVAVGLLACWLPARRAMRVDPLIALRTE